MMSKYHELAIYDVAKRGDIQAQAFEAIELGCSGISLPAMYLNTLAGIVPEGFVLACPIDWPRGLSESKIRHHSIIRTINAGANAIDLVANMGLAVNNQLDEFEADIKSCQEICQQKGVTLRVMLEYRNSNVATHLKLGRLIKRAGVEYVFPSTGFGVDTISDNIIMGMYLTKKVGVNVIINGNSWLPKHYQAFDASGLFGIRFHHIPSIKVSFGV